MNIHKNARTTPQSRAMLIHRVLVEKWPVVEVAMSLGVSKRTVYKWLARYRAEGVAGLQDRSSAARCHPHALPATWIAAVNRKLHVERSFVKTGRWRRNHLLGHQIDCGAAVCRTASDWCRPTPATCIVRKQTFNHQFQIASRDAHCDHGKKPKSSGSGPLIGVSKTGPSPSGSTVCTPSVFRKIAICC